MTTPILKVEDFSQKFGFWNPKEVIKGISFQLMPGEIVALAGTNGTGKSTILNMLAGQLKITSGKIFLRQAETDTWCDITNESQHSLEQKGIYYLPREPKFSSKETVQQIMASHSKQQDARNCEMLLEKFGLSDLADKKICELAGGEIRRLGIALAMTPNTKVLLLDEPFAGMNSASIELCQKNILQAREKGIAILMVDLQVERVLSFCDRIIFMDDGSIVASGTPEEIAQNPMFQEKIFGKKLKALA